MTWNIGEGHFLGAFVLISATGAMVGFGTFWLLALNPLIKGEREKARPGTGVLFGTLMMASFLLLGFQLVHNRVTSIAIDDPKHLRLDLILGNAVTLSPRDIREFRLLPGTPDPTKSEKKIYFLTMETRDGRFFRAGPCSENCATAFEALSAWQNHLPTSVSKSR